VNDFKKEFQVSGDGASAGSESSAAADASEIEQEQIVKQKR
jgi:F-type H+-transporting ATPase subunit alpha